MKISFNKPALVGLELSHIQRAIRDEHLSGDGSFSKQCSQWLERYCSVNLALLTHSCTAALEMAAILAEIEPGDEVILPSYTFVSTANAFLLRGATPVFVDVRADTLNLDERLIEVAITERTRAIVPVHYAGVACEMDAITRIARKHGLLVIEDAAQGIQSTYKGKALGSIGDMGAFSFHETKNLISGEGGAFLTNNSAIAQRAEVIREKGTNRKAFFRGEVDKYSWVDIGSSYLPSELIAAYLWAQFEKAEEILSRRLAIWDRYYEAFEDLEVDGALRRPIIPSECKHNAHMFYLLLNNAEQQKDFISHLKSQDIHAVFHYIPLHSSPMGSQVARASGDMVVTDDLSSRIVRLPLWLGLEAYQDRVIEACLSFFEGN